MLGAAVAVAVAQPVLRARPALPGAGVRHCLADPSLTSGAHLNDRGATDANGCRSLVHENPPAATPVPIDFYQGSGFVAGQTAWEYGTLETTELRHGRPTIRVKDPTRLWVRAFGPSATCTGARPALVCTAAAPTDFGISDPRLEELGWA